MKKAIVITALISTCVLNTGVARAESSKEENIGVVSGAVTGAALAGPVGFVIGAAFGAFVGGGVKDSRQLEQTKQELATSNDKAIELTREIKVIQQNFKYESVNAMKRETDWLTEGLTLNLMFTTNSSSLTDNYEQNIKEVAKILNKYPQLILKLDGYADPVGLQSDNVELSKKRIESVKAAFENSGINPNRLTSYAHGEAQGYSLQDSSDRHALARKVSLNFVKPSLSQIAQN